MNVDPAESCLIAKERPLLDQAKKNMYCKNHFRISFLRCSLMERFKINLFVIQYLFNLLTY